MLSLTAIKNSANLDERIFEELSGLVSEERSKRSKKFLHREDACRCIVGEVLARYCLGRQEKVLPLSIVFQQNNYGKPFANLPGKTQFSISHSNSWVICAVDSNPVGIDIEHIHDIDMNIAQRFFHPHEYAEMLELPNDLRKDRFFDIWTLKESYIKAIGKGLSCPLDSFCLAFHNNNVTMRSTGDLPIMRFKRYDLDVNFKCAVCAVHDDFPEMVNIMEPSDLLKF